MQSCTQHKKIPVAVIGGSGYTGLELVRLLVNHPRVELTSVTSRQFAKKRISDIFPFLLGKTDLYFESFKIKKLVQNNPIVFLCLPHHESMDIAKQFRTYGVKVIDLSADFRFDSIKSYEETYGKHTQKKLNKKASYGLCEIFSEDIKTSSLIGVPGCYVTSILLALAPLLQNQLIVLKNIICDSKSGSSGAGRQANIDQIFSELNGNFKAYSIAGHRHRPEIEEKLSTFAGTAVKVTFTPHLLPITRGILSTIYAEPIRKWNKIEPLIKTYRQFYKKSSFVKILNHNQTAQIKNVVGTNDCHISIHYDDHTEKLIIISAIDNLIKGASGQAVQCLNLMCGFDETTGLTHLGHYP